MEPDEAESAARGSRHAIFACWGGEGGRFPRKDDNEVWLHFHGNPEGRGGFSPKIPAGKSRPDNSFFQ